MVDTAGRASFDPAKYLVDGNPFQITAAGMVVPAAFVFAANLAAATSVFLLGYPRLALAALIVWSGVDLVFQQLLAKWLRASSQASSEHALGKLTVVCFVRNLILIAPAAAIALRGGVAQVAAGLEALRAGQEDAETVDTVHRAIHSIKGAAGMAQRRSIHELGGAG